MANNKVGATGADKAFGIIVGAIIVFLAAMALGVDGGGGTEDAQPTATESASAEATSPAAPAADPAAGLWKPGDPFPAGRFELMNPLSRCVSILQEQDQGATAKADCAEAYP